MNRILNKILSVTLAFAVLFATTSFAADMHFCCDKLVDMAVFSKAKSCAEKIQPTENSSRKCSIGAKDCCSNKTFVKQGEDNLKKSNFEQNTDDLVFLHTFFYTYVNLFENLDKNVVPFFDYDPPWIERNLLVLHETFLI